MIGLTPRHRCALPLLGVLLLATAGCTLGRIEADTARGLQWLRLTPGTDVAGSGRWQLPRDARIQVEEAGPAPRPAWLAAAQAGVDQVFPAPAAPPGRTYRLLVTWPEDGASSSLLPGMQSAFALQVSLVRAHDTAVVEAARLDVSPRWLSRARAGPDLVRRAFRDFAAGFRPAY